MQSVPITTKVSSNPAHGEVYSIQHCVTSLLATCDRSIVFSTNKTDHDITEILLKVVLNTITLIQCMVCSLINL